MWVLALEFEVMLDVEDFTEFSLNTDDFKQVVSTCRYIASIVWVFHIVFPAIR